jgi:hypothetical protein
MADAKTPTWGGHDQLKCKWCSFDTLDWDGKGQARMDEHIRISHADKAERPVRKSKGGKVPPTAPATANPDKK